MIYLIPVYGQSKVRNKSSGFFSLCEIEMELLVPLNELLYVVDSSLVCEGKKVFLVMSGL